MTLFKLPFFHRSHNATPVLATNIPLDSWCEQSHAQPTRFVQKIEMCSALCAGEDAWGTPVRKDHHHTLLRVLLASAESSEETLLIERVLSTSGAHHSVTPIGDPLPTSGTLLHPDVHDRVCIVAEGPSTALARGLEVERTLTFADGKLPLVQFADIIAFVSRATRSIADGGECVFQSRSYAFICMTALGPMLPPRRAGVTSAKSTCGTEKVDDSVFELGSEALLAQFPMLFGDADRVAWHAIGLINDLKYAPASQGRAIYH